MVVIETWRFALGTFTLKMGTLGSFSAVLVLLFTIFLINAVQSYVILEIVNSVTGDVSAITFGVTAIIGCAVILRCMVSGYLLRSFEKRTCLYSTVTVPVRSFRLALVGFFSFIPVWVLFEIYRSLRRTELANVEGSGSGMEILAIDFPFLEIATIITAFLASTKVASSLGPMLFGAETSGLLIRLRTKWSDMTLAAALLPGAAIYFFTLLLVVVPPMVSINSEDASILGREIKEAIIIAPLYLTIPHVLIFLLWHSYLAVTQWGAETGK